MKIKSWIFIPIWLALAIIPVFAEYTIKASIFSSGGGVSTSTTRQMHMSLGQTPAGEMVSALYKTKVGLWYMVPGDIGTLADDSQNLPMVDRFELQQNYPNPFNPTTTIGYSLLKPGPVQIMLYDVLGRKVVTLLEQSMPAGRHQVVLNAAQMPSGVYYYQLKAEGLTQHKKMLLIK
jgi:hypothetical protein